MTTDQQIEILDSVKRLLSSKKTWELKAAEAKIMKEKCAKDQDYYESLVDRFNANAYHLQEQANEMYMKLVEVDVMRMELHPQ